MMLNEMHAPVGDQLDRGNRAFKHAVRELLKSFKTRKSQDGVIGPEFRGYKKRQLLCGVDRVAGGIFPEAKRVVPCPGERNYDAAFLQLTVVVVPTVSPFRERVLLRRDHRGAEKTVRVTNCQLLD